MPIINTIGNASGRAYGFTRGGPGAILLSATPGPSATISTYSGYIVFKFTSTGTLNVGAGVPGTADVFVLAGGSPGGTGPSFNLPGGSGGTGGSRTASPNLAITANTPVPVVVGGASTNSTFGPVTSSGGTAGGSGGASPGAYSELPPTGPPSVMYQVGANGGAGSNGPTNNYETGSPQTYGGGGGGGGASVYASGTPNPSIVGSGGSGGSSGGGSGGAGKFISIFPPFPAANTGTAGSANTGGGGGAGGGPTGPAPGGGGGAGGSGVVIIRFPNTGFRTS